MMTTRLWQGAQELILFGLYLGSRSLVIPEDHEAM
jgi:hypothetical protein